MGIHPSVRISLSILGFVFAFFLCLLLVPIPQQASQQKQLLRQPNDPTPKRQQTTEQKRKIVQTHNLPPEVKYKIRNLQNEDWPKDLEVEIKNVSNKPIYYIYLVLVMDEVTIAGYPAAFILEFGNKKFSSTLQLAEEGDISIKPGESYTFKVPENQIKNTEKKMAELGIEFKVTKVEFDLNIINFGDGTGYSAGAPYVKKKEPSATRFLPLKKLQVIPLLARASPSTQPVNYAAPSSDTLMFSVEKPLNLRATPFSGNSYNFDDCAYWIPYESSCPLQGGGACVYTAVSFDSQTSPNTPQSVYGKVRTLTNPNCPSLQSCPTNVIDNCPVPCGSGGQTNPHYTCGEDGKCVKVLSCGQNTGGCQAGVDLCACPAGEGRPAKTCVTTPHPDGHNTATCADDPDPTACGLTSCPPACNCTGSGYKPWTQCASDGNCNLVDSTCGTDECNYEENTGCGGGQSGGCQQDTDCPCDCVCYEGQQFSV